MILSFIPGLKADKSEIAKKFYLSLTIDNVPQKELSKQEFIKLLKDEDLRQKAVATNFTGIGREGERITVKFPKDQPLRPVSFPKQEKIEETTAPAPTKTKQVKPQPTGNGQIIWFMSKGERVEGAIIKEVNSHGKDYYGIMWNGKLKWKQKSEVNFLNSTDDVDDLM